MVNALIQIGRLRQQLRRVRDGEREEEEEERGGGGEGEGVGEGEGEEEGEVEVVGGGEIGAGLDIESLR